MNKIIFAACITAVCFLTACSSNEPDQDSSLKGSDTTTAATTQVINTAPVNIPDSSAQILNQAAATVNPLPADIASKVVANTAPGMNPAHGQPNHRCDIAVGAPLNSPVSKTPAPAAPAVQTTTTSLPTPTATAAKTVTAPGMNPPHGEPNHRCDISVGAPLNSPVTKPAAPTVTPMAVPAAKDPLH